MPVPGWGNLAGAIGNILDRILDPRRRLDNQIDAVQKEIDEITKKEKSSSNRASLSALIDKLSGLRAKKDRESSR